MARSIGADHVIDYTQEDFTRGKKRYELIFAANGYHSFFDYIRALTPGGIYVVAGGTMAQLLQAMLIGPWISKIGSKNVRNFVARMNREDLDFISELIEAGKVKPVIERRYPLSEAADALRYVGEGHAKGKVVITVGDD
jgi:NADPH:quinone reductase-like Zn-dependent oxidoreductase